MRPLYVAAILTWIAGVVDAVGFLSLGHIYTANMSGNSVAIGIQAIRQNVPEVLARLWPVFMYVVGLLFCRLLIEFGSRKNIRRIAAVAIGFEVALLLPVAVFSKAGEPVPQNMQVTYVALLALAMGVQNAALTHFSHLTLHTGFVTGTLLKVAEQGAKYLTWLNDEIREQNALRALVQSPQQESFRETLILIGIWFAYVVGAATGTATFFAFRFRALLAGMAGLAIVIAMDLQQPLATKEEQEQAAPAG